MAKVFTITEGLENMGAMKTGGQGSVYKGRRIGEIITAIKLLPTPIYSETAEDKNFTSFQNEVQKLKKVNEIPNPNVVKILSFGITDSGNFPFIEMEFIEGPDLEELLKPPHDPVFTVKETLKVADQLSHALSHVHKVGIKHGDLKSNNVKYNVRTGNYVLLDFGLAVMSDEQRRTSLRHAGAIEFMAPEQNEGEMLFQTDVYGFGVVLYELLAGRVPFPLNDKTETGRNTVRLAHIETPPPDLLTLRKAALPESWSEQKRNQEMQVPDWLITMIYKCLEKKPIARFANGLELHDHVSANAIRTANSAGFENDRIYFLEQENKRLLHERERLQEQLLTLQHAQPAISNTNTVTKDRNGVTRNTKPNTTHKPSLLKNISLALVVVAIISALVFILANKSSNLTSKKPVAEYMVVASRAYFHNEADKNTRRNAFAVPGKESVKAYDEKDGFIYTEITNEKGQTSKGWLRKQDLITLEEAEKRAKTTRAVAPATEQQANSQLQTARQFLTTGKFVEALIIYNTLAKQEDPEAMYQYGKLALQNRNANINCAQAFDLIKKSAEKGYVPAKRSLGFLYAFADNDVLLQESNYYQRCTFGKNLKTGSKLLMEATLQGDTVAARLLSILNQKS